MSRCSGIALTAAALLASLVPGTAEATFSGTNGRIIYQTSALTSSSFPTTILSACPNGTRVKTLATGLMGAPSPDGQSFAYIKHNGTSSSGIWIKRMDGSSEEQIVPGLPPSGVSPPPPNQPGWPSWSPDGKKLVFSAYVYYPDIRTSVRQPVVVDIATKAMTPLLSTRTVYQTDPVSNLGWSPGGTDIFFFGRTSAGPAGQADLYRVSAGGGTATRVLGTDDQLPAFANIDFHPDGGSFVVAEQLNLPPDAIFETRRRGTDGGPLPGPYLGQRNASTGVGDDGFSFSPDGQRVLFLRNAGFALMTAEVNGSSPVPVGNLVGFYPRWSSNTDDCAGIGVANAKINEVGLGAAQFVEILGPIGDPAQAPFKLVVFDGFGNRRLIYLLDAAQLQSHNSSLPYLISSPAANAAYGVTGHETEPLSMPAVGQACLTQGAAEDKVNCVSWGCVAAPVSPSSARIPVPGAGQTAQRQGLASTTFHLANPTPKTANVAGAAVDPCPAADVPPGDGPTGGDPLGGGSNPPPAAPFAPSGSPPAGATLAIRSGSRITLRGHTASFSFACLAGGPACTGTATLATSGAGARAAKTTTLGTARVSIAAGRTGTVKITLKKAVRKRVKRGKRLKAKLTVKVTGAPPVTKSVSLTRR
ncbi:MAG: hypothetical protein ACSLFR_00780 [Solirubrobacteraceae bacterium]